MNQEPSFKLRRGPMLSLSDIAEELRCHILGFLSYDEIIRCALTCRTLYMTVKNSVKLQYAIEMGAQRLVQVHPRSNTVSTAECLRILREKANAWSSFKFNATKRLRCGQIINSHSITHRQLGLAWYYTCDEEPWNTCMKVVSKVVDTETCTSETANGPVGSTWIRDEPVPELKNLSTDTT
ncbi:uncharacterized protein EDB91DRAFT_757241 [Suillus paluster]|uniref:uncharacterized protein n=1 Tax=Suillus paluster TaxID=48578 RepID=UPI001B8617DC|nr:uncharacterized protein EDB91DRAFT_757241 [Suillus paluster]KAG1749654.1 hypothetical protein EDB91DRAFT_757241 [Suillus paluster]